jgi:predicted alpha/beta superfamily hydrolase
VRALLPALVICCSLFAQTRQCTASGDLEVLPFASKVFPATRNLRILLPAGYRLPDNRARRYPVLYMNDGQNLFDVCTSLFQPEEWRMDETVAVLTATGKIPPLIVVGIDSGGKHLRAKEYLPYVDEFLKPPEPDPQGKLYPRFLMEEVIPFIEERYRTDSANRALGGSSYGAGVALYAAIQRPGAFAGLLLESPSVYADDDHLLKDAARVSVWPQRIFLGTGTVAEPVEDVQKLRAIFGKAGLSDDRLRVVVQQGAAHSEKWWAQRLPEALEFLFRQSRP